MSPIARLPKRKKRNGKSRSRAGRDRQLTKDVSGYKAHDSKVAAPDEGVAGPQHAEARPEHPEVVDKVPDNAPQLPESQPRLTEDVMEREVVSRHACVCA